MASLVKDYEQFGSKPGVTFLGVCTSTTATLKSMTDQAKKFKLEPFANMLDSGRATAESYGVPRTAAFRLVVVDGDGKFAYNASTGMRWSSGPNAGKFVHHVELEKCMKKYPGILGTTPAPEPLKKAAHYFDLQQYGLMDAEIQRVTATDKSEPVATFAAMLRKKFDEHRAARVQQISDLSKTKPVQAHREAMSFVQAFPTAKERSVVNELGTNLMKDPVVKKEFEAEAAYHRILVPEMKKVVTPKQYEERIQPLLQGYQAQFGKTQFAETAANACKGLEEALKLR